MLASPIQLRAEITSGYVDPYRKSNCGTLNSACLPVATLLNGSALPLPMIWNSNCPRESQALAGSGGLTDKGAGFSNAIVKNLPTDDFIAMKNRMVPMLLKSGEVMEAAGEQTRAVYFIERGFASMLTPLRGGRRIGIGYVGREGVASVHAALGAEINAYDLVMQCEGLVLKVELATIRKLMSISEGLQRALFDVANRLHRQVAQTAACNASHEVVQRLARWLLMAHDRLDGDTIAITHEVLALMLGSTRPGVTIAAGALQKAGLIRYARGHLTVVDRVGLEQAACECYAIVVNFPEKSAA